MTSRTALASSSEKDGHAAKEVFNMFLLPYKRRGRVAHDRCTGGYATCNDGAHPDDGAATDYQGLIGLALLDHGVGPDVGMVMNMNVAVALDSRREGDEVADDAVVLDIAVEIGVEMLADADVRGQSHKRA